MSQVDLTVRATTSNAIQFQLLSGTAAINLTNIGTVELHLKDKVGGTTVYSNVSGGNKIAINGATGGSVTLTPATADLVAGSAPYKAYFKLFTAATTWYFVPEDSEFTINVRETY